MELKTRSAANDFVSILELSGRFDTNEEAPVREWLNKTAVSSQAQVVVNLSKVDFIDSTGLATLVQGMKHCRQHGGDLYLSGLQQPIQIIFQLTRLDKVFQIFSDETQAIQAFVGQMKMEQQPQ